MKQYKIPQNIGFADKIVGPFSLKQLIIVAAGGGISYLIFIVGSRLYELNVLEYVFIAIPFLLSLMIALVKVKNVTFFRFILLSLEFAIKPKKRHWDHRSIVSIVDPNLTGPTPDKKKEKKADESKEKERKNVNLDDLTRILDSGGFENVKEVAHQDIDSAKDDRLVTQAFFGHKRSQSKTQNMYWRTVDSQKDRLEIMSKVPSAKKQVASKATVVSGAEKTTIQSTQNQETVQIKEVSKNEAVQTEMTEKSEMITDSPSSPLSEKMAVSESGTKNLPLADKNDSDQAITFTLEKKNQSISGDGEKSTQASQAVKNPQQATVSDNSSIQKSSTDASGQQVETPLLNNDQMKKEGHQKMENQNTAPSSQKDGAVNQPIGSTEPPSSLPPQGEVDVERLKKGETVEFNLD